MVLVEPGSVPVHQVRRNSPQLGGPHIQSKVRQSRLLDAAAGRGKCSKEKALSLEFFGAFLHSIKLSKKKRIEGNFSESANDGQLEGAGGLRGEPPGWLPETAEQPGAGAVHPDQVREEEVHRQGVRA